MTDAEAREMARELVRGSIVEDAVSQFIAQIIKHTHDERVKPLRRQVANLEAKLAKAVAGLEKCQEELDEYSRQEYPLDHPVHERYRQRDYDANTARATLAEIKGESHD